MLQHSSHRRLSKIALTAPGEALIHSSPSGRGLSLKRKIAILQWTIWIIGPAGFFGLMLAAKAGPHAELLRGLALAWFALFGVANAGVVFWKSRQPMPSRQDDFKN